MPPAYRQASGRAVSTTRQKRISQGQRARQRNHLAVSRRTLKCGTQKGARRFRNQSFGFLRPMKRVHGRGRSIAHATSPSMTSRGLRPPPAPAGIRSTFRARRSLKRHIGPARLEFRQAWIGPGIPRLRQLAGSPAVAYQATVLTGFSPVQVRASLAVSSTTSRMPGRRVSESSITWPSGTPVSK